MMLFHTGSSGDRAAGPQPRAGPKELNASVVFWTDILLVCVLSLFFLLTLPRAMARLSHGGGWTEGHLLRHVARRRAVERGSIFSDRALMRASDSPTGTGENENEKLRPSNPPLHIVAWQARFPSVMRILRFPMIGRIHVGGILICSLYFGLLLFAALYKSSVWTNPKRAGWVAISQIPVVYILATKNNIMSAMLGTAYDKLNYLHRFAGRLLILAGNVHAIGYIFKFTAQNRWTTTIARTNIAWGLVSLILLDILLLFSLAIVRQKLYNLFISTHVVASILFLVTVCLHMNASVPYVAAAAAFYGLDRVLRIIKSRICTATVVCIPEMHMTQLHIPKLNAGWRAGQHVRVRILSLAMGLYGWAEAHPYTIASASGGTAQEGFVLLLKNTGRWTHNLYRIAAEDRLGPGLGSNVTVLIEGPYGGTGNGIPSSFYGAFFIVGGSGISYGLSGVQELIHQAQKGASSIRVVDLVWSVYHPEYLTPILPLLSTLLVQSLAAGIKLRIFVFYTRAVTVEHNFKDYVLPAGLTLDPGRPKVKAMIRGLVDRTIGNINDGEAKRGVFVGTCGPVSLGDAVREAIGDIDLSGISTLVGDVELHEEIFSL